MMKTISRLATAVALAGVTLVPSFAMAQAQGGAAAATPAQAAQLPPGFLASAQVGTLVTIGTALFVVALVANDDGTTSTTLVSTTQ